MSDDPSMKRTRASGEVLEYLLREFDTNQNPNPDQRKEISERTGMTEKAVRIWFQNRRAKLRKFERLGKNIKSLNGPANPEPQSFASSRSSLLTNINAASSASEGLPPLPPADLYSLVDCSSLSVGSWQRVRSGENDPSLIKTMENLAPFTVNKFMSDVDLLVIMSRKNNEINYFFSAMSDELKILFRIFFPITSVVSCSLLDNTMETGGNELRICLSLTPKFSVYFFNGVNANLNQWSICDDFSEGHQVSHAFYSPGGEKIPHVLVGTKQSLESLHLFLMEYSLGPLVNPTYLGVPRVPMGSIKSLHLNESHTPSEYGLSETPGSASLKDHKGKNDFQIKHEIPGWGTPGQDELNYGVDQQMHSEDFENKGIVEQQSNPGPHGFNRAVSEGLENEQYQDVNRKYGEIFTETPEFFATVHTPNNNLIAAHSNNQESLINSPSTNIHTYTQGGLQKDTEEGPASDAATSGLYGTSYPDPMAVDGRNYENSAPHPYSFDLDIAGDFQDSPTASNTAATPNNVHANSHVDTFIDYNGNL